MFLVAASLIKNQHMVTRVAQKRFKFAHISSRLPSFSYILRAVCTCAECIGKEEYLGMAPMLHLELSFEAGFRDKLHRAAHLQSH